MKAHSLPATISPRYFFPFLAALLLALTVGTARAETPVEEAANCINEAWEDNYKCQTNYWKWDDLLCAAKFEAEVVVCSLKIIPH
jgi:hypothetical protein